MTIPNLITEHQKKATVTKLQRALSVINQAYRLAYDDIGEASPQDVYNMGGEAYVNKYWAPYLKIANICNTYKNCGYKKARPFRYLDGTPAHNSVKNANGDVVWIQTIEGFVYAIYYYQLSNNYIVSFMYVDITGGNGPNIFGKDVFIVSRAIDGEKGGVVMPYGYNYSDDQVNAGCYKGCENSTNTCLEKIRRAGWKIDKSYPW